jgi:predicted polyphosphate/ATP-dependent NAD kinase
MSIKVGFLVNPIAGMGGRVGLKGTDGVVDEAIHRGALPIAVERSFLSISTLKTLFPDDDIVWVTCAYHMGADVLTKVGFSSFSVVYEPDDKHSTAVDTKKASQLFVDEKVDIIFFCGGDGTARDIVSVVDRKVPILGIPSGVKMHSAVFGVNPTASAKMLHEFVHGRLRRGDAEIMDLDESKYRKGEWSVRLYATALGLVEPTYIQVGKEMFSEMSDTAVKDEIAEHLSDEMKKHSDTLFLFGAGGTIDYIAQKLGFDNTVLGIDAVFQGKTLEQDVNEQRILRLLEMYPKTMIIISPIGAQGFIFGRGNLPFSPDVIRKIGLDNIIVIATPAKMISTQLLRVDTGDMSLDKEFADYGMMMVVIGYRMSRVVRIQAV